MKFPRPSMLNLMAGVASSVGADLLVNAATDGKTLAGVAVPVLVGVLWFALVGLLMRAATVLEEATSSADLAITVNLTAAEMVEIRQAELDRRRPQVMRSLLGALATTLVALGGIAGVRLVDDGAEGCRCGGQPAGVACAPASISNLGVGSHGAGQASSSAGAALSGSVLNPLRPR